MIITTELTNKAPQWHGTFVDASGQQDENAIGHKAFTFAMQKAFCNALDDDATGFIIRDLTQKESTTYNVLYANIKGMQAFPVSGAINSAAEYLIYEVNDVRGEAKTIANYDVKDFPEVSTLLKQLSVPIRAEGASFSYTIQEIRAAAMANSPLSQQRMDAARMAVERRVNKIIWSGDVDTLRVGVLTDPNVPSGAVPNDGSNGGVPATEFIYKTGQQIYRDIAATIQEIFVNSKGVMTANNLILPPSQYSLIASVPFADAYRGDTILSVLKQNFPGVTFDYANELTGASPITPGADVMLAYEKNIDYCAHILAVPFEMFPADVTSLKTSVYCQARTGGMAVRQPLSMNIKEGI